MEKFSYGMQKFKDFKEKNSLCMCVWALFLCQSTTKHKMLMSSAEKKIHTHRMNIIITERKCSRDENKAPISKEHGWKILPIAILQQQTADCVVILATAHTMT